MKATIIIAALATLAGCATSEQMADSAKVECSTIGYKPGTTEYAQCTERGYRGRSQQQDALAGTLTAWAILEAIY